MQKIKVSLIGYGYWGSKLARNFQNSDFFNLVSIIDASKKNLHKARKDFPLVHANRDYQDILKDKNLSEDERKAIQQDYDELKKEIKD